MARSGYPGRKSTAIGVSEAYVTTAAEEEIGEHEDEADPHSQYLKEEDASYIHYQNSSSATWTVVHNLGYKPGGVVAQDLNAYVLNGALAHTDENQLVLTFLSSTAGVAYLS